MFTASLTQAIVHCIPDTSYMFTVSLTQATCSLYPWHTPLFTVSLTQLYAHRIPDTSYMFSVSLTQAICPVYSLYMNCYVNCTASAFASSPVTKQENLTSPNHNKILSQNLSACRLQNVISLQSACKRMWFCLVFSSSQVQISGRRQASLIKVSRDFLLFTQPRILKNVTPRGVSSDVRGDILAPLSDFGNE